MKYCSECGNPISERAASCPKCGAPIDNHQAYVSYGNLKTNRSLTKYILLSMITFGIYGIVVMSDISESINTVASRHDGKKTMHFCLMAFLLSWLTFGIAYFVWYHRLSARIGNELRVRHLPYSFGAGSFWGWNILGSLIFVGPFIYAYRLLHYTNALCADYNRRGR